MRAAEEVVDGGSGVLVVAGGELPGLGVRQRDRDGEDVLQAFEMTHDVGAVSERAEEAFEKIITVRRC